VGGLSHYLEDEGLPTTHISLIREHTERIKPPRALWVPFELGRPLGVPGDAEWQIRVLRAVLELLEYPNGPVLVDFPDDAPTAPDQPTILACPVNFPAPVTDLTDTEYLYHTLQNEIQELRSWYDLTVAERSRTTVGVSGLSPEAIGTFLGGFLRGEVPPNPRDDMPMPELLKFAIEDLKAYYFEAVSSQPGQRTATSETLATWFWQNTTAGKVLFTLQELWKDHEDGRLKLLSRLAMVPRAHGADSPYSAKSA
jgi:hypothetical protein